MFNATAVTTPVLEAINREVINRPLAVVMQIMRE